MLLPQFYPIACHTDNVGKDSTFVAISGFSIDGHNFIETAIAKGANRIVCEKNPHNFPLVSEAELNNQIPQEKIFLQNGIEFIYVENSRKALAILSAKALDYPAKKLKIVGVSGTKGKTTTTFMIEHVLRMAGFKTALFGSIKNKIFDKEEKSFRATQQSDYLQMALAQCVKVGVEVAILEVSSHALSLDRVYGIEFDVACATNFSTDHMDFHKSIEEYFQAKCKLFSQIKKDGAIVLNIDDEWWNKAYKSLSSSNLNKKIYSLFSKNKESKTDIDSYKLDIINNDSNYLELNLKNSQALISIKNNKIFGEFNAYNFALATIACQNLGIDTKKISAALCDFEGTPGRLQLHTLKNGAKAFVDYAHNQSSIRAILETLRGLTSDLIVIFGCGGERDKNRRPAMGLIAGIYGDKIIITNDNARSEDPLQIAMDILSGMEAENKNKVVLELDRAKAISLAAEISTPSSIIAILGKGHEDYLIINNQRFYFDDFKEISKY